MTSISLFISAIRRGALRFFSGKLFHKSNRKRFSCVCIAWNKHSRRWENSRRLCKPSTLSLVCITVSNFPNPSRVYIRLCKHGKRFLLLKWCTVNTHSIPRTDFTTWHQSICANICLKSRLKSAKVHVRLTCITQKRRSLNSLITGLTDGRTDGWVD